MTAEKIRNYTAEQAAELVAGYNAGQTVEQLAAATGRGVRSVIAKLAQLRVYDADREGKAKTAKRSTKLEMLAEAATALGLKAETLASLEKGSVESVKALRDALVA